VDTFCCWEVINCFQDPDGFCPTALQCFENCPSGDPYACAMQCDGGNYNVPFNDLTMCGSTNCMADCMQPPPPPTCFLQTGMPACDQCINTACGGSCSTCYNNAQCRDLLYCIMDCETESCMNQCVSQYPGGINDLMDFIGQGGCVDANCSSPCNF
jgi:hypothetical protein